MALDLLIIGDRNDRLRLRRRIEGLGYRAQDAAPGEIERALGHTPTAILLWAHEGEIRPLLARLRSHAAGEGIPIVLCGELGGEIRDLADVLELGADRFLVTPIDEEELRRTLLDLLGPAAAKRDAGVDAIEEATDPLGPRVRDPLLDQLRRTLADLDERPADDAADADAGDDDDGIDLTAMGLRAVPRLDEGTAELGELSLLAADQRPGPGARPAATMRITTEVAASSTAAPAGDADASTAIVARRRPAAASAAAAATTVGDLGERPLLELLGWLHAARFSGRVHLEGPSAADLWLEAGTPVHAVGNDPEDRLSAGLRRRGLLTADAARSLHARLPSDTLADGDEHLARAALKPHEVALARADHLEDLVLGWSSSPLWSRGRWSLFADEAAPARTALAAPLGALLVTAARLDLEAGRAPAILRPRERRPQRRPGATITELDPPPEIAGWFAALDGRRPIDEVAAEDPQERLAWLRALIALGRVILVEPGVADPLEIDRRRIEHLLVLARSGDPLALLGVDAQATPAAILRAHRGLARTVSRDRLEAATCEAMGAELRELLAALDRARDVLLDGRRRGAYRAGREES